MKNSVKIGILITIFFLIMIIGFSCKKESAAVLPTLSTFPASNISSTSITTGGTIVSDGGDAVSERGICWGTVQSPTISGSKTSDGSGMGGFTSLISGLSPGVTYYFRAFATNGAGTNYANQQSATTLVLASTLTTVAVSELTATTAKSGGNITADGGSAVTARGVCWNTSQGPTISNSKTSDGTGNGAFTSAISGLLPATIYYIRAYATNGIATAYGDQLTLTTASSTPTLTTNNFSNIGYDTAYGGGNITSDGGSDVTVRGVCWSTSQNPTIANSKTNEGTGTGTFISQMTGLSAMTTYYVRAYATNSIGTSYGTQLTFRTLTPPILIPVPPTVTTLEPSILSSSLTGASGTIIADGGAPVTARGICWSTTQNPTITGLMTTNGTGLGTFTNFISTFTPGITYYVRAYATNSAGTSYGNQVYFISQGYLSQTFNDIDGNLYHAVAIGKQIWMIENLKTTRYRNGSSIISTPNASEWEGSSVTGRYCWYDNNIAYKSAYGALYNSDAATASNIAPTGWHVPSNDEWTALVNFAGGASLAGGVLKESGYNHWETPNTGATNFLGFSALPGGCRTDLGGFLMMVSSGFWWTTTYDSRDYTKLYSLSSVSSDIKAGAKLNTFGLSIRCVKD